MCAPVEVEQKFAKARIVEVEEKNRVTCQKKTLMRRSLACNREGALLGGKINPTTHFFKFG
jgi:hypothetical protein